MMRSRHNLRRGGTGLPAPPAFTLTEILVAVLLLSGSLMTVMTVWSVSRRVTETSRDIGEHYAIARQEIERDRAAGFDTLFNSPPYEGARPPRHTDYDQNGNARAEVAPFAPASGDAYYRAVSEYYLIPTSNAARQQADIDDPQQRLGVQIISVFAVTRQGDSPAVDYARPRYRTTMFFSVTGV